ncbi:MAG: SUMF1/EgtB/PvdO family nonheme iron enzyme [Phycisphaerae bacterium]|nr:SUMF1/EgtB/PvdO family nonheme iron enzyme [Phycisphaerae bacterium]
MSKILIYLCFVAVIFSGCETEDPYQDAGLNAVGQYTNSLGMEFVEMPDGYYVCKTEVSQIIYETIMAKNYSYRKGENLPVTNITSGNAIEFCEKLTEHETNKQSFPEGFVYALPSYEEWLQYVADASLADSNTPIGNNYDTSKETTVNINEGIPNRLGLLHIRGNVREISRDIAKSTTGNIFLGAYYCEHRTDFLMCTNKSSSSKSKNEKYDSTIGLRVVLIPESKNISTTLRLGIKIGDSHLF